MTRDERRRRDRSKALSRRRSTLCHWRDKEEMPLGKWVNNNYVNMTGGRYKTNSRKGHSTYRSKGQYSSGNYYTASDQRKVDSLNSSLSEEWASEED